MAIDLFKEYEEEFGLIDAMEKHRQQNKPSTSTRSIDRESESSDTNQEDDTELDVMALDDFMAQEIQAGPQSTPHTPGLLHLSEPRLDLKLSPSSGHEDNHDGPAFSTPINSEEDKWWPANKLLGKWRIRKKEVFLVKFEGCEETWWEPAENITDDLLADTTYLKNGRNHSGVEEIFEEQKCGRGFRYLITWVGRPKDEKVWVSGSMISLQRIEEFREHSRNAILGI